MIFRKDPQKLKAHFQDLKKIKIHGMRFTIKKINPLLDFPSDQMPQIFTDIIMQRKEDPAKQRTPQELAKIQKDMYAIIESGVVDPVLVPIGKGEERGKEPGITVEDLFRDQDIGIGLYQAVLEHCLNRFKGLKRLFFSIKTRYLLFMALRKNMENAQLISSSQMGDTV